MSAQLKMGLKLTQKLNMTPQLQQSIKLLTLPLMELEQAVRTELTENPVLEEIQDTIEDQTSDELQNKEALLDTNHWMEFTSSSAVQARGAGRKSHTSSQAVNLDNVVSTKQTLQDHLLWQIQMSGFSNKEKAHLTLLVDHLDDNGYLRLLLKDIAIESGAQPSDLSDALQTLHTLDPGGVGARNLQECLLIQARQNQEDTTDLVRLITHHLPDLERKNYKLIAEVMNLQEEEVIDLYKIINAMEPKPGRRFTSQPVQYVTPDVYITKDFNGYKVSLNEDGLPHLKVAELYQNMLKNLEKGQPDALDSTQQYLRHKMNSALWLIRSLNQRQRTIFQVSSAIVRHQKAFFDKGPVGIRPLVLKEVADEVGLHQSTISRITTSKYAYTPHGVYELKYFFNIGITTQDGRQITGEQIKHCIQTYVDKEDKQQPLSDQDLVNNLHKDLGVLLARRTVSRYREVLNILPSCHRQRA